MQIPQMQQVITHDRGVPGQTIRRFPVITQTKVDIEWEPGFPVWQKRQIARQFKLMQTGGNIEDTHLSYTFLLTDQDVFSYIDRLSQAPGVIDASIGSPFAPGEALPSVFGLQGLTSTEKRATSIGAALVAGTTAGLITKDWLWFTVVYLGTKYITWGIMEAVD
jgi:hypothetical protein